MLLQNTVMRFVCFLFLSVCLFLIVVHTTDDRDFVFVDKVKAKPNSLQFTFCDSDGANDSISVLTFNDIEQMKKFLKVLYDIDWGRAALPTQVIPGKVTGTKSFDCKVMFPGRVEITFTYDGATLSVSHTKVDPNPGASLKTANLKDSEMTFDTTRHGLLFMHQTVDLITFVELENETLNGFEYAVFFGGKFRTAKAPRAFKAGGAATIAPNSSYHYFKIAKKDMLIDVENNNSSLFLYKNRIFEDAPGPWQSYGMYLAGLLAVVAIGSGIYFSVPAKKQTAQPPRKAPPKIPNARKPHRR